MRIEYWCKYCKHLVGEVNQPLWSYADAESLLGFSNLSPVEQKDVIDYNGRDGTMYVKTVCDYCQHAVESHPELLVEGNPLQ